MNKSFTLEEIRMAWSVYSTMRLLRMQVNGRWIMKEISPGALENVPATRAESVLYRDHFSFPTFLERRCKNGK